MHFTPEEAKGWNGTGHPIPVLTVGLNGEYKLLETPKIQAMTLRFHYTNFHLDGLNQVR